MTEPSDRIQPAGIFRSMLIVAGVLVGVVLPLDFLLQFDGYLFYLRPSELPAVYAWAWLFYGLVGAGTGLAVHLVAAAANRLGRDDRGRWTHMACECAALAIIILALVRAVKLWLEVGDFVRAASWLSRHQGTVVVAVLLTGTLIVWLRRNRSPSFHKISYPGAIAGCFVMLFAMVDAARTWPGALRSSPAVQASAAKGPNIILITADAFAANRASVYGYALPTTPNLEQLARRATVFERYYANSNYTTPTANSFINGVRPWTHRSFQALAANSAFADQGLIARLKRAGYFTAAVWTNPIAAPFHNGNSPWTDRLVYGGSQSSYGILNALITARFPNFAPVTSLGLYVTLVKGIDRILVFFHVWSPVDQHNLKSAFVRAREILKERDRSKPIFIWLHVLPPHDPYATPAPFLGSFDPSSRMRTRFDSSPPYQFLSSLGCGDLSKPFEGRYAEAIAFFDHHLGEFFAWLKGDDLFDPTLVVVSADHGESFSHGYGGHGGPMLHDDLIRIPLLVKEPGQTVGRRVNVLSEQIDLMPTLLDLAGQPAQGATEGRSLVPALRGKPMTGPVFSMNFEQNSRFGPLRTGSVAMLEDRWKYVHYTGPIRYPNMPALTDALYDLQIDPGEIHNLAATEPGVAARMQAAILQQMRMHDRARP